MMSQNSDYYYFRLPTYRATTGRENIHEICYQLSEPEVWLEYSFIE